MADNYSRIEGTVPDSVQEWVELQSMKTQTPIKMIVGLALSQYKAQNESTNLGERRELMRICERNIKRNMQDLRQNVHETAKFEPKVSQYTHSLVQILRVLTYKMSKNQRDDFKSLRRSAIADHIEALDGIKHSDTLIYTNALNILYNGTHKDDIGYLQQLSKSSRGLEGTYNKDKTIIYTGGTLENNTIYDEVSELASNCMTVPIKHRADKIESAKEHIMNTYEQNEISDLISMFMCEIDKLELKK